MYIWSNGKTFVILRRRYWCGRDKNNHIYSKNLNETRTFASIVIPSTLQTILKNVVKWQNNILSQGSGVVRLAWKHLLYDIPKCFLRGVWVSHQRILDRVRYKETKEGI